MNSHTKLAACAYGAIMNLDAVAGVIVGTLQVLFRRTRSVPNLTIQVDPLGTATGSGSPKEDLG